MTLEEIVLEISCIKKDLKMAHKAIDDFYAHGRYQMGFGPMMQSQIISGCNARLEELKQELIKLGFNDEEAAQICSNPPPQGLSFEACLVFIARYS